MAAIWTVRFLLRLPKRAEMASVSWPGQGQQVAKLGQEEGVVGPLRRAGLLPALDEGVDLGGGRLGHR